MSQGSLKAQDHSCLFSLSYRNTQVQTPALTPVQDEPEVAGLTHKTEAQSKSSSDPVSQSFPSKYSVKQIYTFPLAKDFTDAQSYELWSFPGK